MRSEISRRDAIKTTLAAGFIACGAAGCQSAREPEAGMPQSQGVVATAGEGGTFIVPAASLEKDGQLLATLPDQRTVLIFKTNDGKAGAVTAKCPHQGGTIAFDKSTGMLRCPLHGSKFDTTGKVVTGPATAPLEKFNVVITGNDAILKS